MNLELISLIPSSSNFNGVHTGLVYSMYQRVASAPYLSKIVNGSTALPLDLCIFCPYLSNNKSLTNTFLYGAFPVKNTEIAINE